MAEVAAPLPVSIIVPVLNEAEGLEAFVRHLRERGPDAEVLLVDGGSTDGTAERARALEDAYGIRLLHAPRGRARQMNAGAAAASGGIFLFLHADTRLPEAPLAAVRAALRDPGLAGGCFRLRIPRPELIYRVSDSLGNLGVDLFGIALGDHGLFCRREVFQALGGYPEVPLMEDAELYRRLRPHGVRQLPLAVETSPRRYRRHGPYRTTFLYAVILALYAAGVSPDRLARIYARLA